MRDAMRGQVSLEVMAWLTISAIFLLATLPTFMRGIASIGPLGEELALRSALAQISSAGEAVAAGGQRVVEIEIPRGVSNVTIERLENGAYLLGLDFRGSRRELTVPFEPVFIPDGLLERFGSHRLLIESAGDVVVIKDE